MIKKNLITKMMITENTSIFQSLKKLDQIGTRCLFVVDHKKKLIGTLTDGDIRRQIIKKKNFEGDVKSIFNKKPIYILKKNNKKKKINISINNNNLIIPIVNEAKVPVDFYPKKEKNNNQTFKNQIIVMAGGMGTRLKPFTNVLPKPLIPLNGKPMILNIIDQFHKYNFKNFTVSLKSDDKVMFGYLNQFKEKFKFEYFFEKNPLGTAGCLKKIENLNQDFFVVNCDTFLNINLNRLLNTHVENKSMITIVACMKSFSIPYGECLIDNKGNLKSLIEKPKKKYFTNTGMYLISPKIKKFLPKKQKFGMDEVIKNVFKSKNKISIYPVNDKQWKDTGNWINYFEAYNK